MATALGTTTICARRTARIDVNRTLRIAVVDVAVGRSGHSLLSTATARLLQIAVVRAGMSEIRDVAWGSLRCLSRRSWIGQTYPQPRRHWLLELLTSQRQRSFPGALQA